MEANTIKGHGLTIGDRVDFYGMATKDGVPTAEATRCKLGKVGNKYLLTTVQGEVMTWEFGATAKIWADLVAEDSDNVVTVTHALDNGDTVYQAACEHGWSTGFYAVAEDAARVARGHGSVTLPVYEAPVAPVMRTADGVKITDGMAVWDYDLNPGTVDLSNAHRSSFDGWFDVKLFKGGRSLMNAERVCVKHPSTRKNAADMAPVAPASEPCLPAMPQVDDLIADTVADVTYLITRADEYWIGFRKVGTWREGHNVRTSDFLALMADGQMVNMSARLAMPEERPTVEIHTGDGVITESDVKARWTALNPSPFMDHIGHPRNLSGTHRGNRYCLTCEVPVGMPTPVLSDRDMADQVLAYLAPMADDFYVDGMVSHLIKAYNGVVDINDLPEGDFSKIVAMFHKVTHVQTWGRAESAIWGGTATGLKRPVATLVNRRKRKASKVNKRRVKGGF